MADDSMTTWHSDLWIGPDVGPVRAFRAGSGIARPLLGDGVGAAAVTVANWGVLALSDGLFKHGG